MAPKEVLLKERILRCRSVSDCQGKPQIVVVMTYSEMLLKVILFLQFRLIPALRPLTMSSIPLFRSHSEVLLCRCRAEHTSLISPGNLSSPQLRRVRDVFHFTVIISVFFEHFLGTLSALGCCRIRV